MSYPGRRYFFQHWPDSVWRRKTELAHKMVADVRAHISNLPDVARGDVIDIAAVSGSQPETLCASGFFSSESSKQ